MGSVRSINKKLTKVFEDKVEAHIDNDCLMLTGEVERWGEVIAAGMIAAGERLDKNIVNEITCTLDKPSKPRRPRVKDTLLENEEPDVLIIGGGIIGCFVARELSRYKMSVLVVEKENDIGMQATGHCTGLVHSGIGLLRGTMKYWYTRVGNRMFDKVCKELSVPFRRCGQYLVYTNRIRAMFLYLSYIYWWARGLQGIKIISGETLRSREPGLNDNIRSALYLPTGGVVCPQTLVAALAENAKSNGVHFVFNTMVHDIEVNDGKITGVSTNRGTLRPKIVINAAGLFCEDIAEMADDKFYSVHPIKGTNVVFDRKYANSLIGSAVTAHIGKSGRKRRFTENLSSIQRTVHGSVLAGPFYFETINKEDYSTDRFCVDQVISQQARIVPALKREQAITYYAGISAATYHGDFVVGSRKTVNGERQKSLSETVSNLIHAAGISFPGLTASPAIAEDIAKMTVDMFGGERTVAKNPDFNPVREAPPVIREMSSSSQEMLIAENPDYGILACHCEQVTKGEIIDVLRQDLIKSDCIDAVKRRTRACMGTCQGSCCAHAVLEIIASEKRISPQSVRKSGSGSEVVFGDAGTVSRKTESSLPKWREDHESDEIIKMKLRKLAENPQLTASIIGKDDEEV